MVGKKSISLFILILTLLVPAQIFAGGNPEIGLPKVDRLIKERNYNEAILELANYMNENPEDFDGAQRRLKRIIKMRESYNDKALELLLVLSSEPTNDQKKLEMITYMESLEKTPNAATQNFILETKAAAQFTYYRAKFDEIMQTGDALIDAGQYVEAARKFQEGFVFYKQEFDEETGANLVSQVNGKLGEIIALIGTYQETQASFEAAVSAYRAAVEARNPDTAETLYGTLDAELSKFSTLRNRIAENGWFFEDTFALIQKEDDLVTENSFLPFAYRFTLGRKTSNRFEGILGACDAQWNKAMDGIETTGDTALRKLWTDAIGSFDSGSTAVAAGNLQSARRIALLSQNLATSLSRFTVREETYGKRNYQSQALAMERTGKLIALTETLGARYGEYRTLSAAIASYEAPPVSVDVIRKMPAAAVVSWNKNIGDLDRLSTEIATGTANARNTSAPSSYMEEFNRWSESFSSSVSDDRMAVYARLSGYEAESSKTVAALWQTSYGKALAFLDGIKDAESETVYYYPSESIAAFNALRTGVASDRKAISAILESLVAAPETIRLNSSFTASTGEIRTVLAQLDRLYADSATGITRANSRVLQANLARQESDLRYTQARSALKKNDFQGARDNLQRSREKINVALSYQEDAVLRTSSDQKLEALGAEITRTENEAVVREVRALISSGKNFYYLGNMDQAEQIFIQAKSRWSTTNIDPNPEVSNWLEIINTALSMKTGRTIPVSAPLYPQMSQILNTANQLYSEGKALIADGKRAAAIVALTDAKTKLQQLQLVYPLNQDAGQLKLKIDQLIDPFAFTEYFKQKVEYIRLNYRTERQTAYSDLLDLYQINPSYPGIKKLVDEIEIYLGIKIPPPDPKALARSTELTKAARKTYDSNIRTQFESAILQLDEAIKLNPDNQSAILLKDRIQTAIGGQSVAVLSAGDEAKYQQAVQELQKGNKITASALVEQLMQNPKSRNSAKIQDLKKRIDSQL